MGTILGSPYFGKLRLPGNVGDDGKEHGNHYLGFKVGGALNHCQCYGPRLNTFSLKLANTLDIFGDIRVSMGISFYRYRRAGTTRSEFGVGVSMDVFQHCGMSWGSLSSFL